MNKFYIGKFCFGISLITLLSVSSNSYAEMYKWVDEEGNVHYTQSPPPGGIEGETIKPPPPVNTERALQELEERQNRINSINEERSKTAEEQQNKEEDLARQKANCELARDKLAKASGSTRLFATDAQGERVKLGEEERQARIDAAKKDIAEFCK